MLLKSVRDPEVGLGGKTRLELLAVLFSARILPDPAECREHALGGFVHFSSPALVTVCLVLGGGWYLPTLGHFRILLCIALPERKTMLWSLLLLCLPSIRFALPGPCGVGQPLGFQLPRNISREAAAAHSEKLFRQFVWRFNRSYAAGSPEFVQKYKVFQESIRRHYSLNLISSIFLNESGFATFGINQFSDIPPQVFRATYLSSRSVQLPKYISVFKDTKRPALPPKFDWRDKNVVTPVQNQQSCGGCWAFSIVESIESLCAIKEGHLKLLSAQEVIDCSYRDAGCKGGSPINALMWLNESKAKLVKESEYPFSAKTGMCHYFSKSTFGVAIKDYKAYNFRYNEDIMMEKLLEWGPLVVVVDAVSWQDYLGGIIQHHCSQGKSNHAVVITGYDTTDRTSSQQFTMCAPQHNWLPHLLSKFTI